MTIRNVKLKNRAGEYLQPYTENLPTASTSTAGKVKLDSSPTSGSNNAITSGAVYTALSGKLSTTGTAAKATADASGNNIANTYLAKTGTAAKATADANGNNIANTYATKTELTTVQNSIPADSGLVHKTGSEDITGNKVFNQSSVEMRGIPNDATYEPNILFHIPGVQYSRIAMTSVGLAVKSGDGSTYSSILCDTPVVSDNSNKTTTTAYINNKFKKVSALPSNPDANTYYFIPE